MPDEVESVPDLAVDALSSEEKNDPSPLQGSDAAPADDITADGLVPSETPDASDAAGVSDAPVQDEISEASEELDLSDSSDSSDTAEPSDAPSLPNSSDSSDSDTPSDSGLGSDPVSEELYSEVSLQEEGNRDERSPSELSEEDYHLSGTASSEVSPDPSPAPSQGASDTTEDISPAENSEDDLSDAAPAKDSAEEEESSDETETLSRSDPETEEKSSSKKDKTTSEKKQTSNPKKPSPDKKKNAPDEVLSFQFPFQSFSSGEASAEDLLDCYAQAELDCLGSPKLYMAKLTTGNRLDGIESALYQTLRDRVSETADGSVSRAEFHVPVSDLGLRRTSWTAKELGLQRLTKQDADGNMFFTEEALDLVAMNMEYDLSHVVNALLADCPYELYWYDKTVGTLASGYSVTGTAKRIEVTGELVFYMAVVSDYSTGEYSSIHLVDPDGEPADYSRLLTVEGKYGAAVKHAVANASAILAEKADSADYTKLSYYAGKICALADYNDGAATPPGLRYGNPWQIIWLFDGDPSTTVVCESYSKGLQYLCDKSSFHSDICCYSVMGRLRGENHMWNIVRMDDGNNYLVDLTNGDLGEEMNDDLFLAGSEDGRPDHGYRIVNELGTLDNEYLYSAWTLDLFTTKELTLAPAAYLSCRMTGKHMPGEAVRENESEPTYETDGHYDLAVYCEICGEELSRATETIPKKVLPAPKLKKADSTEEGVALSWESVPDATGYTMYRKGPGDTKWQPLGQTTKLSWVDTTAENGVSYRYTVKAKVGKASSAYADSQSIIYRWETEQSDPQKGPKTGDSSLLRFWLLLWLCSTESLMVFIPTVHRRRQSQKTNL